MAALLCKLGNRIWWLFMQILGHRNVAKRIKGVAQRINIDGINVQLGAANIKQKIAVTTAQQIIKDRDTKADSFKDVVKLTSRSMRHRAKAPVSTPTPNVCANAIEMVPAARA